MKTKWGFAFLISIGMLLTSCNYTNIKNSEFDGNAVFKMPPEQKAQLSYVYIYQTVFAPKCVSCHGNSGRVNLETYQGALDHLSVIKKSVFQKQNMPRLGSLSFNQKAALWNWIEMGAPKDGDGTLPPPDPITPTYDSIDQHIFQVKCITCHTAGKTGERILLDKESLLNSPLELVIPGNADESGLVVAVERADDKRMPTAKEGYSKLTDEEIGAIRKWIMDGASK